MTFTVTYRGADGALREEAVEAASRAECFAQMKARGIVPVSVKEGARKGGRENAASPKMANQGGAGRTANVSAAPRGGTWKAAVLATGVLAVAGGAWWWLGVREDAPPPEPEAPKAAKVVKEVKAVKDPGDLKDAKDRSGPGDIPDAAPKPAPADFQAMYPRTPGHLPLPGGNVITFQPPAPGCTTEVFTVGGLYLCDSEGNFVKYEPPRLFDNRFENTIESLAMNKMLILSPRTKKFSDKEIAKYLERPITVYADDPPDVVDRKAATAAMKEEIRDFIKNGGTYQDYVDQLHDRIGSERTLHREAMREMVNLLAEGDVEGARIYRKRIDQFLSENGYLGLKLPDEWQRKLDGKPGADEDGGGDGAQPQGR